MAFTKVLGPGIHTLANVTSHNINSSGIITATKFVGDMTAGSGSTGTFESLTVTGNLGVGGTLTYMDVTNVDAVGIITAQEGIHFGIGATAGKFLASTGITTIASLKVGNLTSGNVTYAGSGGELVDSSKLTFNGADLLIDAATNEYKGVKFDNSFNLTFGSSAGTSARLYLKGTSNGQSDAGDTFLGTGTGGEQWFQSNTFTAFKVDADGTTKEALRIASNGNVGVNTDFTGSQTWRNGQRLEIFGGGGNVTGELHLGANRGDSNQSVGSINFFDNSQDSTHRHIALIEADKSGSTSNKRGGDLIFFTKKDNTAAPNEKLRITSAGKVGINVTTPEELLDLGESNQQNLKLGQRGYLGQAYSTTATILGHSVKADTTNSVASQMMVTETNSGGGAPSAIRQVSGTIQLHTLGSGTADAVFDSERMRIANDGKLLVGHTAAYGSAIAQVHNTSQYVLDLNLWDSSTDPAVLAFYKSRNDTPGSATVVQDDDGIGSLRFLGNDGTNSREAAYIKAYVDGSPGTDVMPGRLVFGTTAAGAASATERARITSEGWLEHGKRFSGSSTVDTGIYVGNKNVYGHAVFEVIVAGNPNHFGSGSYAACSTYILSFGVGWDGVSQISTRFRADRIGYGDGGSSNTSEVTATFHLWDATTSTESSSGVPVNGNNQLRIKIAGSSIANYCRCYIKLKAGTTYLS